MQGSLTKANRFFCQSFGESILDFSYRCRDRLLKFVTRFCCCRLVPDQAHSAFDPFAGRLTLVETTVGFLPLLKVRCKLCLTEVGVKPLPSGLGI